ncbi:hypothetical protein Tco_0795020 [Tanacetum coccineum]
MVVVKRWGISGRSRGALKAEEVVLCYVQGQQKAEERKKMEARAIIKVASGEIDEKWASRIPFSQPSSPLIVTPSPSPSPSTSALLMKRHFRINISQLSVIGAAKVSHFEILCRVYGIVPTVGLFHCFYVNSKKNGWISFSKRSDNALDGEDIFTFIHTPDPTKVKVTERQQVEDEPRLLETTVGRTVLLLPVAPKHAESELDASVDKLFDEGGSGAQTEQGDSTGGGGGQGVNIHPFTETTDTVAEVVVLLQPRRPKKRKTIVADAGGPSHPPKKLTEDHGTPSGAFVGGKSRSAVQRLLVGAVQNAEVRGEPIPTLPFVTSSVSATPECEGEDHTDSVTGLNLRTISAPQRFVIFSDSSHHSCANVAEAEVDSFARPSVPVITASTIITSTANPATVVQEKIVKPFDKLTL